MFLHLFSPLRIGKQSFRNRMFVTGLMTKMITDGVPKAFINAFTRRVAIQELWRKAMGEVHV